MGNGQRPAKGKGLYHAGRTQKDEQEVGSGCVAGVK